MSGGAECMLDTDGGGRVWTHSVRQTGHSGRAEGGMNDMNIDWIGDGRIWNEMCGFYGG